jgi:hypothetical protein
MVLPRLSGLIKITFDCETDGPSNKTWYYGSQFTLARISDADCPFDRSLEKLQVNQRLKPLQKPQIS